MRGGNDKPRASIIVFFYHDYYYYPFLSFSISIYQGYEKSNTSRDEGGKGDTAGFSKRRPSHDAMDVCHLYGRGMTRKKKIKRKKKKREKDKRMAQAERMYQMAPMGYRRALLGR